MYVSLGTVHCVICSVKTDFHGHRTVPFEQHGDRQNCVVYELLLRLLVKGRGICQYVLKSGNRTRLCCQQKLCVVGDRYLCVACGLGHTVVHALAEDP